MGTVQGGTDKLDLDFTYGTTANNGNVLTQTINFMGLAHPFVQTYTYDSLNRLDDANETYNDTQTWRQDFSFDRYGNRNFVESNTSFAGFDKLCNSNTELCATLRKQLNPGINSGNNNRMNSGQDYTYDAAGNTLTDANGQIFVYDGENKQVKASTSSGTVGEYFYDGDGKRVKKYVPGTGETTIFVYDAAGKQIAEYSTIVADASTAKVAYLTADHLGSPRINTDVTGAVASRHDYHPFGEEIATSQRTSVLGYADDTIRKQFTGYEIDGETDLDFAMARMYANRLGRFSSIDFGNAGALDIEPQSWNAYSYSLNNPVNITDPSGLQWVTKDGENYEWIEDDVYNSAEGQATYGPNNKNGWRDGNGGYSLIASLHGSDAFIAANRHLIGNYAYHNADGSLSLAGTPGPDGVMILAAGAPIIIEFPIFSSAAGAAGGILSNPITVPAVLSVGSIGFLIWNGGPDMLTPNVPRLPSTPNSATNVATAVASSTAGYPNCACAAPTILQMAKGGKQNIKNEWNAKAAAAVGGGVAAQAEYLKAAKANPENAGSIQKINTALKAIGAKRNSIK
ncbi:MAG: RHS repeat-associated core domain-containing protein [Chloracidobacterium sp.]|nr:RHS repeat-associated core domain-containing protein [Chloracidobacterium sp.]